METKMDKEKMEQLEEALHDEGLAVLEVDLLNPDGLYLCGQLVQGWLNPADPTPAKEQIHRNYGHGGGWNSFRGFKFRPEDGALLYAGDPPQIPVARIKMRDETIYVYYSGWVNIVQPDGTFDVARID